MPRPRKCRMVGFIPTNQCFQPQVQSRDEIILSIEEFEAIRLSDYLLIEQRSASESMNVSRGTFQRIINSAHSKIADALVHGKIIRIAGGDYQLSEGNTCCKRHVKNCTHKNCEKCENCQKHNMKIKYEVKKNE